MAVQVLCDNPQQLLSSIKAAIHAGTIETWTVDKDGDLTHTPPQWRFKAWFRPAVSQDKLVFNILGPQKIHMSKEIYGIYHGRLIEMLLVHFDLNFRSASSTALPTPADRVKGV